MSFAGKSFCRRHKPLPQPINSCCFFDIQNLSIVYANLPLTVTVYLKVRTICSPLFKSTLTMPSSITEGFLSMETTSAPSGILILNVLKARALRTIFSAFPFFQFRSTSPPPRTQSPLKPVSYTHLTLPTNSLV